MKYQLIVLFLFALIGCGGSNEVVYPEKPTVTPPAGSLSTAEESQSVEEAVPAQ